MASIARTLRLLDEVQHLAQLQAFAPAAFAETLDAEMAAQGPPLAEIGNSLDELHRLFGALERFAQKCMSIQLLQALDPLPPQLRTLFASTITSYDGKLPLLRERVGGAMARLDRATAAAVAERVVAKAEKVLVLWSALRQGVGAVAQRIAFHALPAARAVARDRTQPEDQRAFWARACTVLEQVATHGELIESDDFAANVNAAAAATELGNEGNDDDDPVARRFSLLEID